MAQRWTGGAQQGAEDAEKIKEFEGRVDKNNPEQVKLLEEMKAHEFALRRHRQNEDPRLSFSTPEFKEASRIFTENFKARKADASGQPVSATPPGGRRGRGAAARRALQRACCGGVGASARRGVQQRRAARCYAGC